MSSFEVEQSFRNLVRFYSKELVQIYKGDNASNHFNYPQRKNLTKTGILVRVYSHKGSHLKLSSKTISMLLNLSGLSI